MDNIADNLESKYSLAYVDVRSRLLVIPGSSKLSSNGTACDARSHKVNKFNNGQKNFEKPNLTRLVETEPP